MRHILRWLSIISCLAALLVCPVVQMAKLSKKIKKAKENCPSEKEIDRQMALQYTFGNSGRFLPESLKEFPAYCEESNKLNKVLENYANNCVDESFTKHSLSIMVNTVRRESRNICKIAANNRPSKKQALLIKSASCVNAVKDKQQKCIEKAILFLQDSINIKNLKEKTRYICCNTIHYDECMIESLVGSCSEKNLKIASDFLNSIQGNAINFLCSDYTADSDRCDFIKKLKPNATAIKHKSVVIPFIETMRSIDFD